MLITEKNYYLAEPPFQSSRKTEMFSKTKAYSSSLIKGWKSQGITCCYFEWRYCVISERRYYKLPYSHQVFKLAHRLQSVSLFPYACTYTSDSRTTLSWSTRTCTIQTEMDLLQKEKFCHCLPLAAERGGHISHHLTQMGMYVLRTSWHSHWQHPAQLVSQQITTKAT